ncbi:MAG: SDR family NAD(P)-dependent oxidoreductase, partial [Bacteroidetes bacterium]
MFFLTDKTALVSGAASGIGLAITELFARAGARVFLTDINPEAGEAQATRLRQEGLDVQFLPLNVSDAAACDALAAHVLAQVPRLDVLVNNAGVGGVGTMLSTEVADLDRMYQVNVRGVFNLSHAF